MIRKSLVLALLIFISPIYPQHLDSLLINTGKIKAGFINNGIIGDFHFTSHDYGWIFEGKRLLFSAGLYLTGKNSGELWSNGVFPTAETNDYLPGKFGDQDNSKNKFYLVKSTDPDFGDSWLEWKNAVELGASFYDGNGDEIYNPVDLNGNGTWDFDEDKPDLIGDYTAWNVFHDGVNSEERKFEGMTPLGIEIEQTIFGSIAPDIPELNNAIYIKYKIRNTGYLNKLLDSVYIGLAWDFDIGDYTDELNGCDIEKNIGYTYNDISDIPEQFGDSPPAIFLDLLQGPQSYIPSITYLDNNENNVYDHGVDTPIDSALIHVGTNNKIKILPGAKNLGMTSYSVLMKSIPPFQNPRNIEEVRTYLIGGRYPGGDEFKIEDVDFGNGDQLGDAVDTISNKYFFSGNPVEGTGWLNTEPWEYRFLVNSGPFDLKVDQPVEIMFAVLVGRGSDNLNSITEAYKIDEKVQQQYDNNFTDFPVGVDDKKPEELPNEIVLHQNYPNPFNPSTVIEIELPKREEIDLSVYNVLGQKVMTLFKGVKNAGRHSFVFNAENLASQVLFLVLKSNYQTKTKKITLLK